MTPEDQALLDRFAEACMVRLVGQVDSQTLRANPVKQAELAHLSYTVAKAMVEARRQVAK